MHARATGRMVLAVLMLCVGAGIAVSVPPSPGFTSEKMIADPGLEPFIAINPTDSRNLIVVYQIGTEPARYTTDTRKWTISKTVAPISCSDPHVTFDGAGRIFMSELRLRDGVEFFKSTDKGAHFGAGAWAMDRFTSFLWPDGTRHTSCRNPVQDPSNVIFDFPRIVADKNSSSPFKNNLYVTATVRYDVDNDLVCEVGYGSFARSTDGGATWIDAQALSRQPFSNIGVGGPEGTIYLATWSSLNTLPDGSAVCPGTFGIALFKSTNGGASFAPPVCAYAYNGNVLAFGGYTAVDPSNSQTVYMVFQGKVANLNLSEHIFFMRSTDGGSTWTAPQRVDDVAAGNDAVNRVRPTMSVSTNGRIDIAWMDNSAGTPSNPPQGDIIYTYSSNGGTSFATNVRLSTVTSGTVTSGNDYLGLAPFDKVVYATYSQNHIIRGFGYEVYVNTITHP